jgi:ABC-type nitrate/sulfonate/bicarbonate transport system permease component
MKKSSITDKLYPLGGIVVLLVVWQVIVVVRQVPGYILTTPVRIGQALVGDFPLIAYHLQVTIYESLVGFGLSIGLAFILAVLMDGFSAVKKTLYPILVISQTVPIIALAPLFIIWFGFGILPKIIIVVIVCFFPIAISLVDGMDGVDDDYLKLFETMKATKTQTMLHLKLPFSMGAFFSGLKIAATYMIMSAVIGEWLGGDRGIGVYMLRAKNAYALDRVFASILVIVLLSVVLISIIDGIGKRVLKWQDERNEED